MKHVRLMPNIGFLRVEFLFLFLEVHPADIAAVSYTQLPITFPGMPTPVKLGLAGGPLVVALSLIHI